MAIARRCIAPERPPECLDLACRPSGVVRCGEMRPDPGQANARRRLDEPPDRGHLGAGDAAAAEARLDLELELERRIPAGRGRRTFSGCSCCSERPFEQDPVADGEGEAGRPRDGDEVRWDRVEDEDRDGEADGPEVEALVEGGDA